MISEKPSVTHGELASHKTEDEEERCERSSSEAISEFDGTTRADSVNIVSRSLSGNEGRSYCRETGWQDVLGTKIELEANEVSKDREAAESKHPPVGSE